MLGAIIGDMVGSLYEFHPCKTKDFNIYNHRMVMTDDSYLTIAVANVLMKHYPFDYSKESLKSIQRDLADEFVNAWEKHEHAGFGGMFYRWCTKCKNSGHIAEPYNSYGNGSAMRISPVGWVAKSEEEVKLLSKTVTEITHNHPEGLKGAEAVAMCIYLALNGASKKEIEDRMVKNYYPEIATLNFEELVKHYYFSEICQKSVPQAIYCFLISDSLEDTIRNCVAIGGDCDTTGAMAGAIAEAYYQKDKPSKFEEKYLYLLIDPKVEELVKKFHETEGSKKFCS
jgi:type I restriction enzyme M protein